MLQKFIVLCSLSLVFGHYSQSYSVSKRTSDDSSYRSSKRHSDSPNYASMNYNFKYASNDDGKHSRSESNVDGVVRGSYSYIDPNGHLRKVNYIADKNGFRVEGDIGVDRATAEAAARLSENIPEGNYEHSTMNKLVPGSLYNQYHPLTRQTSYFDYSPHYTSNQSDELMASPKSFYQSRSYTGPNKPLSMIQALNMNLYSRPSLNLNSNLLSMLRKRTVYQKTMDNQLSIDPNLASNKKEDYAFHYNSHLSDNDQINNKKFHLSPVFDFQQFKDYGYGTRSHQLSKQKDQNVLFNRPSYKDRYIHSPNELETTNEKATVDDYGEYEEQRGPSLNEVSNLGSVAASLKKVPIQSSYFVNSPTHEIQFWS